MSNTPGGGAALSPAQEAEIQAAANAAAVTAPVSPGSLTTPQAVGINAMPTDANTWLQVIIPPAPSASFISLTFSITVTARILRADGSLAYCRWDKTFAYNVGLVFSSDMPPGYLVGLSVTCNTAGIVDGMMFVIAGLIHQPGTGNPLDTVLIASYVSSACPLSWPQGHLRAITDGKGFTVVLQPANPLAGSPLVYTVVDAYLKVTAIQFTLTTSVTVGNRLPYIAVGNSAAALVNVGVDTVLIPANTVAPVIFMVDVAPVLWPVAGTEICNMEPDLMVSSGGIVSIQIANIFAGDQLSAISILGWAWL